MRWNTTSLYTCTLIDNLIDNNKMSILIGNRSICNYVHHWYWPHIFWTLGWLSCHYELNSFSDICGICLPHSLPPALEQYMEMHEHVHPQTPASEMYCNQKNQKRPIVIQNSIYCDVLGIMSKFMDFDIKSTYLLIIPFISNYEKLPKQIHH